MSDFVGKCDFEPEFHNSSSVWRIVLAVAARKIYLLGNLFVMAQGNNPSVPKMQLDDLDFADDLALLPHNQRQIQDKTIFLGTMSAGTGLKISKKKTELMKINTTANKPVTVGGDPIMEVDSVIYLGSAVDRQGGTDRDVTARIGKVRVAFVMLKNIWSSKEIRTRTKLRIFNSNVKSVLLYGCETWRTTKTMLQKIQTFFNTFLRRIYNT